MAQTLSRAFARHANWVSVIPDEDRRARLLTHFFRFTSAVIDGHGIVAVVPDRSAPVGYITFLPADDEKQISLGRIIRAGVLGYALRFVTGLRLRELGSMARFAGVVSAHYAPRPRTPQPRTPSAVAAHLYFTGIDPRFMGRGIMKSGFAACERALLAHGYDSYVLETTDPGNLPVYERFGLIVTSEMRIPGTERVVYFLERALAGPEVQ